MLAYLVRRILLMIPTIFGILLISFVIVQFAPGGPVERILAQLQGLETSATANFTGGDTRAGGGARRNFPLVIAAHRDSIRNLSPNSTNNSVSTNRRQNVSGSC